LPFLPLFDVVISGIRLAIPVFKPICVIWQLDVARYGWQKRQDRGKNGKVDGTISTDFDRFRHDFARPGCAGAKWVGRDDGDSSRYVVAQVLAEPGGFAFIELVYHK